MALSLGTACAEDWTVAGHTYQNEKVTKVEADCVHVMYDGGLGAIQLADLPPDLQKRFNYEPAAAKLTAQQREADRLQAVKDMEASMPAPKPANLSFSPAPSSPSQIAPAPVASASAAPSKPAIDRPAVQYQIDQLNHSIAVEESELARNTGKEASRQESSQNPYRDLIAEQHREVAELTAELNAR
jgi:hypothetical protein